MFIEVENQ